MNPNLRGINDLSSSSSSSSVPESFHLLRSSSAATAAGGGPSPPPNPGNPIRAAIDEFAGSTPFVTRSLAAVLWTTHLLSWLAPSSSLALALANYPEFALGRLEIYRIFTSLLVNPGFVDSLLFHLAVVPPAKTLEGSLGSARLAYYIAALSIATNLLFLAGWLLLAPWGAPSAWRLAQYTSSLWIAGFGLLALEAVRADNLSIAGYGDDGDHEDASRSSSKYRRVCFLTVRTRYSPLAMYGLMTLLSMRFDAGYLISLLLGYAAAYQWCHGAVDRCLLSCLSLSRIQGWEAGGGWLSRFVSSAPSSSWTGGGGYVSARSATGIQASRGQSAEPWSGSMLPLFQMSERRSAPTMETSGGSAGATGRALGGGGNSNTSSSDNLRRAAGAAPDHQRAAAREARLQALERNRKKGPSPERPNSASSDAA